MRQSASADRRAADGSQRDDRTVGYDFSFHVPKSVSLLYATTRDERIIDAFRDAVDGTMHEMEAEMATRVRKGGKNENRRRATWSGASSSISRHGQWTACPIRICTPIATCSTRHLMGREALEGRPVPRVEAGRAVFRGGVSFAVCSSPRRAGPADRANGKGWELAGVDRDWSRSFRGGRSRSKKLAKEKGISDPELKAELGGKTREA